jgi:hypothetical protein
MQAQVNPVIRQGRAAAHAAAGRDCLYIRSGEGLLPMVPSQQGWALLSIRPHSRSRRPFYHVRLVVPALFPRTTWPAAPPFLVSSLRRPRERSEDRARPQEHTNWSRSAETPVSRFESYPLRSQLSERESELFKLARSSVLLPSP